MKLNCNRVIRSNTTHETYEGNLWKNLRNYARIRRGFKTLHRIKEENDATREMPDSWADINRKQQRIAQIREAHLRTKAVVAMPV